MDRARQRVETRCYKMDRAYQRVKTRCYKMDRAYGTAMNATIVWDFVREP